MSFYKIDYEKLLEEKAKSNHSKLVISTAIDQPFLQQLLKRGVLLGAHL